MSIFKNIKVFGVKMALVYESYEIKENAKKIPKKCQKNTKKMEAKSVSKIDSNGLQSQQRDI